MLPIFLSADTAPATPIYAVLKANLESLWAELPSSARAWGSVQGFEAALGTTLLVPGADGTIIAVIFGLGSGLEKAATPFIAGKLVTLPPGDYAFARYDGDLAQAVLGFALSSYRFESYKKSTTARPRLVLPASVDGIKLSHIAKAVWFARDLVNTPANDLGPAELARIAVEVAESFNARVSVTVGDELKMRGLNLIYAVGVAAHQAPRLVDFTWGDANAPKVTLVGKGVTFDTGGLNIKPDNSMLLMKKDMGGAANVLALARLIMESGLKVRLRVILPIVENAISASAFRPGDVFTSRKGLTVEIGNTDAEGRLILADALNLADEDSPDLLADFATLTGAARVALGADLPPIYTHDDALADALSLSAKAVHDPLWRMPLWGPYDELLSSKIADLNNAPAGGLAGSITAALFLARFVEKAKSWLHADIFAWTPTAKPGKTDGGEAQVIRALFDYLEKRYGG